MTRRRCWPRPRKPAPLWKSTPTWKRLDAPAELLWEARGRDVLFVISTDAHRVKELDKSRWGIRWSRRGWVPKKQVANTRPAAQFLEWAASVRRI